MGQITQGRRVMPNEDGWLTREADEPATYGRATSPRATGRIGWWQVAAPDGSVGSLNPAIHTIEEHEDGTITVSPSLDYSKRKAGGWHGWLKRGVFESC